MGSDDKLQINIIFMLAIKEPKEQLKMLQKLTEVFQDDNALEKIKNAKNELEVLEIMKSFLDN
jgi:PTS system galactitol-specific IIA component